jgi:hypothetical protein
MKVNKRHDLCTIALGGTFLCLGVSDILGGWSWDSGSSGVSQTIPASYTNTTATTSKIFTTSGVSFTKVANSTTVSVSGSMRADGSVYSTSGTLWLDESASATAYGTWNWTSPPGSSTSVVVHAVLNFSQPFTMTSWAAAEAYTGASAEVGSVATSSGYFAQYEGVTPALTQSQECAYHANSYAYAANADVVDLDAWISTSGAFSSLSDNSSTAETSAYRGVATGAGDFEVDIDTNYNTTAGVTRLYGVVSLGVNVYAEVYQAAVSGQNQPAADGQAHAGVTGTASLTYSF